MISVYDIGNEDFEKNGNCVLTPESGSLKQVAGGSYDVTIVHPMDPDGKWEHLVPGAIVKVPVPVETIENAMSGYAADIYKTTTEAELREDNVSPETITYPAWGTVDVQVGTKVSYGGRNWKCVYWDPTSYGASVPPGQSSWWQEIPRMTSGAAVLVTLPTGSQLYLIEDVDSNWYKMSTYYGIVGYILKTQVQFWKHVDPEEIKPRVITEQLFRLREPTVDNENQKVTVTGMHVSYDLSGVLVQDCSFSETAPAMAIGRIVEQFMIDYRGTVATNLTGNDVGTYTGDIKGKNGIYAFLDPDKGIVPSFDAKLTRDNWDIFIMKKTETDRGFQIRYGKNARGINWKRSSSNLITRVVPVAKAEGGEDLYLPEKWVDSTHINDYPVILMERLKVDGQVGKDTGKGDDSTWTEADLLAQMRTKAGERFSVDHVDEIAVEVTVQLESLEDTAEYAYIQGLQHALLYDTVKVIDYGMGLNISLYVTEIEYDIVREKVSGLKLANTMRYTGGRTVTGYNVMNNSIGRDKLTDDVYGDIMNQVRGIIPEYSDPAAGAGNKPNSKTDDGYVTKGQGQSKKVWATNADGEPGWRSLSDLQ